MNHQESLPICLTNTVHMQIGHTQISSFVSVTRRHAEKCSHKEKKGKTCLFSLLKHPSIHLLSITAYPLQGLRGLEPIPLFKAWIMLLFSFIFSPLTHTRWKTLLTRALLLIAGPDLLSWAVTGVALYSSALAHPEATLPTSITCLAAEAPVIPAAPVTSAYKRSTTSDDWGLWS